MPVQSLTHFDDSPGGIGSVICSPMESSRSSRAMKRRNLLSQKTLQESFLLPTEGAVTHDCMFCDASYKQREELGKHMLVKHRATLLEPSVLCVEAEFLSPQDKRRKSEGSPAKDVKDENEGSECEVCGQTFVDPNDLESHMKKHKDSFTYSCNICGRRFKEPWFLKNHKKTHSSRSGGKTKPYQPVPETPVTINEIVQEEVTGSLASPFKLCVVCGFYFPDKESLLAHSKKHIKGSTLPDNSSPTASPKENVNENDGEQKAKENFLSFLNLRPTSAPTKQPETARKWIGELDPFNTYQAWQLATKGKVALSHGQRKEPCFEVSAETDSSSDKEEIAEFGSSVQATQSTAVEETEVVKSEDSDVGAVIQGSNDTVEMFNAEIETKPPSDRKFTTCNCGKVFKTYHQLILHSRVHRKDRSDSESSISCDSRLATDSSDTPAGPEDEGNKTEEVSEEEESGGDSAPTDTNEADQSLAQSKGLPISRECGYCRKTFRSNYYLNIHLRTHTGEKPYKCEFCDYAAAQKTSLRYHLERHHKFKPGESNARVKSISKSLQLLKKQPEPPSADVQPQEIQPSELPRNDDKDGPLMAKPPKRMSALRNKLVSAKQDLKKELSVLEKRERVKAKLEEARAATSRQLSKTPSPPLDAEEEISLACTETLDDDPCLMEEKTSVDQSINLNLELVVEDDPAPLDLCTYPARDTSTKSYRALVFTCPYCTYKTLYPEVLSVHQRLVHKQNNELINKVGPRGKNPSLVLKMRRTGCPPALNGVDVPPLHLDYARPKVRPAFQAKQTEKPRRAPAQANKVITMPNIEQENKPHPIQQNKIHPVQQNGRQSRNYRYMQPDLQGIKHLLERMPQPEQRIPQWNPSTSQKSGMMVTDERPYPIIPSWSGEHPFNRPVMAYPELGEPFTKRLKHNISNPMSTTYLNPEVKRLDFARVHVNGPEIPPGKLTNPPLPNKGLPPYGLDPRWNVLQAYEPTAAGPLHRNPNMPLGQESTSAMEVKNVPLYQRMSKRGFGPNEKPN